MAAFRLPRLPINWKEQPQLFERYWDEAMSRIEDTLNAILEIPELQTAIAAAEAAADAANAAADNAQSAADATAAETSLVNSYVANFVPPLISVDEDGIVTIVAHDRVYGDPVLNPAVVVTGGVVNTAATAGQTVRIYYDQPSRAGGAVTYQWTVDPADPPVQGGDRHSVGIGVVPAVGDPPANGGGIKPPGWVDTSTL